MTAGSVVAPSNAAFRIETNGINVIPDADRNGRPRDLFWIWFGANIGILALTYGAIILGFGLNFWQGLLCAIGSALLAFLVVGAFSVAGRDGGAPMFTLSRAVFGIRGNVLPNIISWLSLLGWETIGVILGVLALMSLLGGFVHTGTAGLALICIVLVGGLVVAVGLLGQATLVVVQTWASYVFGALTLVVAAFLIGDTNWSALLTRPEGPWLTGFIPAASIIAAGTGLSWANAAADYSRYLPRATRASSIVWASTLGAVIPVACLMIVGMLLTTREPTLGSAANPIAVIQSALPAWMGVPFLVTAVVGLIVEADMSLYSSGLNLLNLGVPFARYKTVAIDAVVMVLGTAYVVLVAKNFFSPLVSFLLLLGVGLAAWAGVFLVDQLFVRPRVGGYAAGALYDVRARQGLTREGWNRPAIMGWLVGVGAGLLVTTSPLFSGPLAKGVFANSSLEIAVAFIGAGGVFGVWSLVGLWRAGRNNSGREVG
ncbi:MAG: purine-cytosine permease family protein [Candidatus Dormibacteria bacterium]